MYTGLNAPILSEVMISVNQMIKPFKNRLRITISGNLLKEFVSSGEAAKYVGSNTDTFRKAIRVSPNNFTKGYVWKYA